MKNKSPKKTLHPSHKKRIQVFITRFKKLQGTPHYVAKGMAIGIFIGVTPTIPFHMIFGSIFLGLPFVLISYLITYKIMSRNQTEGEE